MSGFGEDFKAFRIIVWHSINVAEGRIRFMPYLDVLEIKELKVEDIGHSSHCLTNLETTLSKIFNHPCLAKIRNGQVPGKF